MLSYLSKPFKYMCEVSTHVGRVVERERALSEVMMLLPVLARGLGRPEPAEMEHFRGLGLPVEAHLAPGHVQVLMALGGGARPVGWLAEEVGVSRPAASQLVDRLEEHGIVERRPDPADRRVVLVDYVPGMREVARGMMEVRRRRLEEAFEEMDDREVETVLRGLRLLVERFEGARYGEHERGVF
jgi:DNA-binding MarR family transcriptional regulator